MSILFKGCRYCHGTGDYRGLYGVDKPDYRSEKNKCYHCDGTGDDKTVYNNTCKYCLEPCNGYACESCLKVFEAEREEGDMDEAV